MTINLCDSQGRDWTVEGDWRAQVIGADFDGRGQILMWMRPASPEARLEPLVADSDQEAIEQMIEAGPPLSLPLRQARELARAALASNKGTSGGCEHNWVDPSNEAVEAGDYRLCTECHLYAIPSEECEQ